MAISQSDNNNPVLGDQMKAVLKQLPLILLINLPLVIVLGWLYWPWVNQTWLLFWAAAMLLVMALRFVLVVFFGPRIVHRLSEDQQQYVLVANSAISGFLWACAGALFFVEGKLEYQLIILMILIVKGTGSVSAIINSLPAFYAYFPVSMLPITILFLLQPGITSILLGVICLIFIIIMMWFARNLNRTLLESIRMRYENNLLLEETEIRKQEAEKANLTKTHFLAAASHDLRQPIHAMSLLLAVLEENNTPEQQPKVLNKMRGTVESLENLLNALLDISRLDAGSVKVDKKVFTLMSVLKPMQDEFQILAEQKELLLFWPQNDFTLHSDPILLEQVLRNLITNAIRYTNTGRIIIDAEKDENKLTVSVADTGIGISKIEQDSIFDEFYQVGNQQRDRNHGLGLGLAIVKRILDLLESKIQLESSDKGSCFSFCLDLSEEVIDKQRMVENLIETKLKLSSIVCILEDDEQVSDAMQTLLQSWGCSVLVASNAEAMIKKLNYSHVIPDVIISDLQLGDDINGVEESECLWEEFNRIIPTVIITGNIEAEQLADIKQKGLPVLYKPVAPARIRTFLRSASKNSNK